MKKSFLKYNVVGVVMTIFGVLFFFTFVDYLEVAAWVMIIIYNIITYISKHFIFKHWVYKAEEE